MITLLLICNDILLLLVPHHTQHYFPLAHYSRLRVLVSVPLRVTHPEQIERTSMQVQATIHEGNCFHDGLPDPILCL